MDKIIRALIVDDSEAFADSVLQSLEHSGHKPVLKRVDSLSDMNAAIDKQSWDLIVCDYFPAPFNALSTLRLLKEKTLDLPFIMVADAITGKSKAEVTQAGADAFILKSDLSQLSSIVENGIQSNNIYCNYQGSHKSVMKQPKVSKVTEESMFQAIIETLGLGLLIVNKDMEVIYSNNQISAWFSKGQENGRPLCYRRNRGLFQDDFCAYCPTKRVFKEGGSYKFLVKYNSSEGNKSYQIVVLPIIKKRGKPELVLQLVEDITHHKQKEDALRMSQEQLRQSQRTEALGMLATGMTHDLNNLLTAIMGYADLLLLKLKGGDPFRGSVEQIKKGGLRAISMIQHLLNFNRKQEHEKKELYLNKIITDMECILSYLIDENIKLRLDLDPDTGKIKGDKGRIEQIIMNLCLNAGEAMPKGGELVISAANLDIDENNLDGPEGLPMGNYVRLAIKDNGCGMDKETLAHIYEPFYTTKEPGEGAGLGLSTVYGIINQSKGHIKVHSKLAEGTTFEIYLPRIEEDGASDTLEDDSQQETLMGSEMILLVEDETEIRTMIREVLQRSGYKVIEARSPGDAILVCEQYSGMIHLMIANVMMPMMSGRELFERLALWHPEMKELYMSEYTEGSFQKNGTNDSNTTFLKKPFLYRSLLQKVRKALGSAYDNKSGRKNDSAMIQYNLF